MHLPITTSFPRLDEREKKVEPDHDILKFPIGIFETESLG